MGYNCYSSRDGEKVLLLQYLSICLSLSLFVLMLSPLFKSPYYASILWKSFVAKAVFNYDILFVCVQVCICACMHVCEFTGSEDYCYLRISSTRKTSSHLFAWMCINAREIKGQQGCSHSSQTASTKGWRERCDIHKLTALLSQAMLLENKNPDDKKKNMNCTQRIMWNWSVLGLQRLLFRSFLKSTTERIF